MFKYRKIRFLDKLKLWSFNTNFHHILLVNKDDSRKRKYDKIYSLSLDEIQDYNRLIAAKMKSGPVNMDDPEMYNLFDIDSVRLMHWLSCEDDEEGLFDNAYFYYFVGDLKKDWFKRWFCWYMRIFCNFILLFYFALKYAWKNRLWE